MEVSIVDFYNDNAAELLTASLKQTGFAILESHPIEWELVEEVYKEWRDFLLSNNAKKYEFNKETQDGYFPLDTSEVAKGHSKKDLKHYFHLYFPNGRYPLEVSSRARDLAKQLSELGKVILKWIDKFMDPKVSERLSTRLIDALSVEHTLLRIIHYPAIQGDEEPGAIRAAAHEDINLITLLPVASSPGLEIYSRRDDKWYEVPCKPKSIIVNIGDMLQEMSSFEYIATKHRVVKPEGEAKGMDRMSIPYFLHPKRDVYLSERYPTAKKYLDERLTELGVK